MTKKENQPKKDKPVTTQKGLVRKLAKPIAVNVMHKTQHGSVSHYENPTDAGSSEEDWELNAIADARQGNPEVCVTLDELMAEIPDGFPRAEGWDAMTPVGKEILGERADQAKASAERAATAIDEALDFCEASNKRIEAMESAVKAKSSEPEEPFFKTLDQVISEEAPAVQTRITAAGDKLAAKRDAAVAQARGESILLSQRDASAVAAAIENPPPPNKHLKAAVARARQINKRAKLNQISKQSSLLVSLSQESALPQSLVNFGKLCGKPDLGRERR
jgi:hypothetical protein